MKWYFANDCRPPASCEATRVGPHPDPLFSLRLGRASLNAAWGAAVDRFHAKYGVEEADSMFQRAADNLAYWKANPATWDNDFMPPEDAL